MKTSILYYRTKRSPLLYYYMQKTYTIFFSGNNLIKKFKTNPLLVNPHQMLPLEQNQCFFGLLAMVMVSPARIPGVEKRTEDVFTEHPPTHFSSSLNPARSMVTISTSGSMVIISTAGYISIHMHQYHLTLYPTQTFPNTFSVSCRTNHRHDDHCQYIR